MMDYKYKRLEFYFLEYFGRESHVLLPFVAVGERTKDYEVYTCINLYFG